MIGNGQNFRPTGREEGNRMAGRDGMMMMAMGMMRMPTLPRARFPHVTR